MCATIIWIVNQAAYSEQFVAETMTRLQVAPQPTEYQVLSSRVRPSMVHFTLTTRMCDCDGLVGLRGRDLGEGETGAQSLIGWIHEMPSFAPLVSRLALLRAWNPDSLQVRPQRARGVLASQVGEQLLRHIADNALLTIDY